MYILATDTSTENASVALLKDRVKIFELNNSDKYAHNRELFRSLDIILKQNGLKIKDIDLFAIGSGPGSFTGLRIGMAAVKGMASAYNKKVIPVCSMDAMAFQALKNKKNEESVNIIAEGRQKDYFHSEYIRFNDDVKKIKEITVHPYRDFCYIKGKAEGNVPEDFISSDNYSDGLLPCAEYIGILAFLRKDEDPGDLFEPEYHKQFKVRKDKK